MLNAKRHSVSTALLVAATLSLAGCASSGVQTRSVAAAPAPEQLTPIQNMPVASSDLPVIGGAAASQTSVASVQQLGEPVRSVNADGSFVTLDAVGSVPNAPGRDLTGGLTIEKLLGGWTIVSGAEQCKLNLTYTAKTGTSRYRASTPGCAMSGLKVVASWQLVGTQVQLFDENGDIIASLILSGNRFIGTVAGGQGISMVG